MPHSKTALHIADGFSLPLEAITAKKAILAKTGAGKSTTAAAIVEETLDVGVQVIIIDPKGDWYGLRSSADGKEAGYPVTVMGGDHGDLPLDPAAGKAVAEYLAGTQASFILDVSDFLPSQMHRFVADFATHFFRAKKKHKAPVLVVLEEADDYCPQNLQLSMTKDLPRCVGAIMRLVKQGRFLGIGTLIVTQRSASLNKNVLTQSDILILMRTTSPQDKAAAKAWLVDNLDADQVKAVMKALGGLETGEGFVWSVEHDIDARVRFRRRRTFDAGETPKIGKTRAEPKVLAQVDLDRLRADMEAVVEDSKANDPKALKAEVAALRKTVAALERDATAQKPVVVPTPVLSEDDRGLLRNIATILGHDRAETQRLAEIRIVDLDRISGRLAAAMAATPPPARPAPVPAPARAWRQTAPTAPPPARVESNPDQEHPTAPQARILAAVGRLHAIGVAAPDKTAVAFLAGNRPTSGGFKNNLGKLRSGGWIDYPSPGTIALTESGQSQVQVDAPANLEDHHAQVQGLVPAPQWRILEALIAVYPGAVDKNDLAASIDVSPTSGGYKNNLGRLRSIGLIAYPERGTVAATGILMLDF